MCLLRLSVSSENKPSQLTYDQQSDDDIGLIANVRATHPSGWNRRLQDEAVAEHKDAEDLNWTTGIEMGIRSSWQ